MKFSLFTLTAGLLVAIGAASPSSDLRFFGNNFVILDTNNLALNATPCVDTPIGKLITFTITDCAAEPCTVRSGVTYTVTYIVECGAPETTFKLVADVKDFFPLTVNPSSQGQCEAEKQTTVAFTFTVPVIPISVDYTVDLKLVGNNGVGDSLESCTHSVIRFNPPAKQMA